MSNTVAGHCAKCGIYRWSLDKDHILPKCFGGSEAPDNIQYLCQNCHHDKSAKEKAALWSDPERRSRMLMRWTPEAIAKRVRTISGRKHSSTCQHCVVARTQPRVRVGSQNRWA